MRLWPRSLAGRLALLLVLTLLVAQVVSFALFARERITAFGEAHRGELAALFVSLVRLIEDAPVELHERLAAAASSSLLRIALSDQPAVPANGPTPAPPLAGSRPSSRARWRGPSGTCG